MIRFYVLGITDRSNPPSYPVASETIDLVNSSMEYLMASNALTIELLNPLMHWLQDPDIKIILSTTEALNSILSNDEAMVQFI